MATWFPCNQIIYKPRGLQSQKSAACISYAIAPQTIVYNLAIMSTHSSTLVPNWSLLALTNSLGYVMAVPECMLLPQVIDTKKNKKQAMAQVW